MSVGARIKMLREQRNLSLDDLAKSTQLNMIDLIQIEKGERQLKSQEILALSQALDVSVDDLFKAPEGEAAPAAPEASAGAGNSDGSSVLIPVGDLQALLDKMKD